MSSLATSAAWQALQAHHDSFQSGGSRLADLFKDQQRYRRFSLKHEQLLLDYSKNLCTEETIALLLALAEQCQLPAAIKAMFAGEKINSTEDRAALHTALRVPVAKQAFPEVTQTLERMQKFVAAIESGQWLGCSGEKITDVVNIGIGGSDLGPVLACDALQHYRSDLLKVHFVSNIDPEHLHRTVADLNPATTLFIIASKSFGTLETKENALSARQWFLEAQGADADVAKHFVAVTSNTQAAIEFGIAEENLFPLWDWVGGRYSLWSAIGLPIALSLGMENFSQLLAGAHSMDEHFRHSSPEKNMPVLLALLSIWYSGFFGARSTAVVPYSHALKQFPAFLQQLSMESLGKQIDTDNAEVSTNTGEIIWGSEGTNAQHSYFQLLHQGTDFIPVDFIAIARTEVPGKQLQQQQLLANCLSQSEALMLGESDDSNPARNSPGNRPSNTLVLAELNPYNLGNLLALYEHKVYVQSVIWGINAFDQWGVELGKKLSRNMNDAFSNAELKANLDSSSRGLVEQLSEWK